MMRFARFASLITILTAGGQAFAQGLVWDSTGDSMLNGTYYFREALWQASASSGGALSEAAALYGTISFTGTGSYTITGTLLDLGAGTSTPGETITGTYAIGAGGFGYLTHPLISGAQIRGMVA